VSGAAGMALLCWLAAPSPALAQAPLPAVSLRPFVVVAAERLAAKQTFSTIFGNSVQPFYGGGLELATRSGFFLDVTASRFRKTGERAFFFEGQGYGLGVPLTATITPVEITAGARNQVTPRVFPYFGVGVGSYRYQESSAFGEDGFDKRHVGYLVVVGVEFRVGRWVGISGDLQYTHVSGIIGAGGLSLDTGESNLGGTAGRVRVIVGR
jgi:opacity protein-like surface antigen